MNFARLPLAALLAGSFALSLTACDDDSTPGAAAAPTTPTVVTVAAAPLVISAATPATANGTLDKTPNVLEAGISDSTGNFSSAGPNDYCRTAAYLMPNSGDGKKYKIQVIFAKSTHAVSYMSLDEDATPSGFSARANSGLTSVAIDTTNRRIGFTNTVLNGANSATLNGSLEFMTNGSVADRASCG